MNAKALIAKKRDGLALEADEIAFLVGGAARATIPDEQLSAFLMAAYLNGMTREETAEFTRAMLESGDRLRRPKAAHDPTDKHSTGGVGDKISFLVAPLVAACGVPVPMISGRSLGHTGGTLDKLESISGFRTELEPEAIVRQVESIGLCLAGQSARLAPADRKLYALRDATSTVESVPLITASILCKKAAANLRGLTLDVKLGDGAFMRDAGRARELAESLVRTGALLGLRSRAYLTDMDHLLGRTAGNALEVAEAASALRDRPASPDIEELVFALGASMLELVGAAADLESGVESIRRAWDSGAGFERFVRMVEAQGGDVKEIEDPARLPRAQEVREIKAPRRGYWIGVKARAAGEWITLAGGGRLAAKDRIDPRVGVECLCARGEEIRAGQPVVRLHMGDRDVVAQAEDWLVIAEAPPPLRRIVRDVIHPAPSA